MISNLSKIIVTELQMNVDFMLRMRDNFTAGVFKIPDSFLYHIAAKYNIPISVLNDSHQQIVDFIMPTFTSVNRQPIYSKKESKPRKKSIIEDIPVAKFA